MKRRRLERGFTLIELLLVVVIIGILAAIVVPKLAGRSEDARITAARADLQNIDKMLDAYEIDAGRYPTTDQNLAALLVQPTTPPLPTKWKGPYLKLKDLPKDPWGNLYVYENPGRKTPTGYDLYSLGPDGKEGGGDDIEQ